VIFSKPGQPDIPAMAVACPPACCERSVAMPAGNGRRSSEVDIAMQHYYAIAERGPEGDWFLTFPPDAGSSFAEHAEQIVAEADRG
jgi:hypothetical protein